MRKNSLYPTADKIYQPMKRLYSVCLKYSVWHGLFILLPDAEDRCSRLNNMYKSSRMNVSGGGIGTRSIENFIFAPLTYKSLHTLIPSLCYYFYYTWHSIYTIIFNWFQSMLIQLHTSLLLKCLSTNHCSTSVFWSRQSTADT